MGKRSSHESKRPPQPRRSPRGFQPAASGISRRPAPVPPPPAPGRPRSLEPRIPGLGADGLRRRRVGVAGRAAPLERHRLGELRPPLPPRTSAGLAPAADGDVEALDHSTRPAGPHPAAGAGHQGVHATCTGTDAAAHPGDDRRIARRRAGAVRRARDRARRRPRLPHAGPRDRRNARRPRGRPRARHPVVRQPAAVVRRGHVGQGVEPGQRDDEGLRRVLRRDRRGPAPRPGGVADRRADRRAR